MSLWGSHKNLWKGDLSFLRAGMKILIGSLDLSHLVFQTLCLTFSASLLSFSRSQTHTSYHTITTHISWTLHLFIIYNVMPPRVRRHSPHHWSDWLSQGRSQRGLTLQGSVCVGSPPLLPPKHRPRPPPQNGNNYSRLKISNRHDNPTQCVICNWFLNFKENIYKGHYWIWIYSILDHISMSTTHTKEKANRHVWMECAEWSHLKV